MSEACAAPVLLAVLIVEHRWHEPVFEAIAEAAGIGGKSPCVSQFIALPHISHVTLSVK